MSFYLIQKKGSLNNRQAEAIGEKTGRGVKRDEQTFVYQPEKVAPWVYFWMLDVAADVAADVDGEDRTERQKWMHCSERPSQMLKLTFALLGLAEIFFDFRSNCLHTKFKKELQFRQFPLLPPKLTSNSAIRTETDVDKVCKQRQN